jgi:mannose/fructose/N-acetylgalactosamine-specific phosphotransferase system component IIB
MIALFRVDDRLIHGQVVLGWGSVLRPDRIILADDEVASNEWEKSLYAASVPPEIKVSILPLPETAAQIKRGIFDTECVILLVRHPKDVVALMDLGLREGRAKVLDNVYIDEEERNIMRELVKRGVILDGRAVPGSRAVTLNSRVV